MVDIFISHSSRDNAFVEKLISKLKDYNVWYDEFCLEAGHLPEQLSENIIGAKWFLFIASQTSVESNWTKYEFNIAVTHWIEEEQNFKILVVKIDDCKIPSELISAVRIGYPKLKNIDEILEETVAIITGKKSIPKPQQWGWRKKFVNRFRETAAIEDAINEGLKFIVLYGNYGIGKTSVAKHAIRKIFEKEPIHIRLTKSHDALMLALQLAAKADLEMPEADTPVKELLDISLNSLVELNKKQKVVFFDDLDQIIRDNGMPDEFFINLMHEILREDNLLPILISTSWYPSFPEELETSICFHKIGPLSEKHLLYCLENWIKIANPSGSLPDKKDLERLSRQLYGYPLAARFASFLIVKYGIDIVLKDTGYFKDLKTSMAKQLLGRIRSCLLDSDVKCLLFLTVADTGLTTSELQELIGSDIENIKESIERLFSALLLYYEGERYMIIPIVKDYFWRVAHERGLMKEIALKLAQQASVTMTQDISKEDFVIYAARAYRLYMLAGRQEMAQSLKYKFRESIEEVVARYYHSRDYNTALSYANLYLELGGSRLKVRWYRARCLTRLERYSEAVEELRFLEERKYPKYMVEFARGLLYRDKKDFSKAIIHFKEGLDEKPDYLPLLRELGHAYLYIGDIKQAFRVIKAAYEIEPRDVYIALKYTEILQEMGKFDIAMDIISSAVEAFPDEPGYHLRYSKMLRDTGKDELAYEHALRAVKLDKRYTDAILHLASLEVRKKNLEKAKSRLEKLPSRLSSNRKLIKTTVEAEIATREKDFERARKIIKPFKDVKDSYVMDVLARIELYSAYEEYGAGNTQLAKERIKKSKEIIMSAIEHFPNNFPLLQTQQKILELERRLQQQFSI